MAGRVSQEVLDSASVNGNLINLTLRGLEDIPPIPTRIERTATGYRAIDVPDCTFTSDDVVRARQAGVGFERKPGPPAVRPIPALAVNDRVRLDCDLTNYDMNLRPGATGLVLCLCGQAMRRDDGRFVYVKFDGVGYWDILPENLSKL